MSDAVQTLEREKRIERRVANDIEIFFEVIGTMHLEVCFRAAVIAAGMTLRTAERKYFIAVHFIALPSHCMTGLMAIALIASDGIWSVVVVQRG